jgi:hypothetical protein
MPSFLSFLHSSPPTAPSFLSKVLPFNHQRVPSEAVVKEGKKNAPRKNGGREEERKWKGRRSKGVEG